MYRPVLQCQDGLGKVCALIAFTLVSLSSPAAGQDGAEQGAPQDAPKSGSVTILRDVPFGTALHRYSAGQTLEVKTGPEETILAALAQGLKPLTDAQQASVFGSNFGQVTGQTQSGIGAFDHIENAIGSGLSLQHGESGGGAVGNALSQMPSVGGILRGALGDGQ